MIIKEKDPADKAIQKLEEIKQMPNLPKDTLARVDKELRILKAGNDGESDSAYFINFRYKDSPNWAVIHDLRLEYLDRTAQIDHLLINRLMEFYVLETKSYVSGLKINDRGEFSFRDDYRRHDVGIESPIEQNERHIFVLEKILKDKGLMPTRLGIAIPPKFKPYVLVAPKSSIDRSKAKRFNTDMVVKADSLFREIDAHFDSLGISDMAKLVSSQTVQELGQRLVKYHTPIEIDYYAKLGVPPTSPASAPETKPIETSAPADSQPQSKYYCFKCRRPITLRVAQYCFDNRARFGGKAYCMEHQKDF